jgi:hypothetical protein
MHVEYYTYKENHTKYKFYYIPWRGSLTKGRDVLWQQSSEEKT